MPYYRHSLFSFLCFTCFRLLMYATPIHKYDQNNSLRIIIFEIIIIKVNTNKIYTKKTHVINKNVTLPQSLLTKAIPLLEKSLSSSFSIILLATNQSLLNFNACRKGSTTLSHVFESYIYQVNILA